MTHARRFRATRGGAAAACCGILATLLTPPSPARAQDGPRNEVAVTAEPIAGSAQLLHDVGRVVQFGGVVSVGPVYGAWFDNPRVREWASLYPVLALRMSSGVRALLSPVGLAVLLGNDFGSVYPSAQGGLELTTGRVRIASSIRVVRIAGGHGSGNYHARWIPVRVGYAFRW